MRRAAILACVGFICGTFVTAVPAAEPRQQPTFRAEARTVAVYATVQDAGGRLVPDLIRDDFDVFEDGARREITQFSSDPQPLNTVVLLQTGSNMLAPVVPAARRLHVRDAVLAFVDALHSSDRARIGTFGLQIALSPHLTNDRTELRRVLDEETWAGGGNPLWQALIAGMRSIESEPQRRVVLVFTNGFPETRVPAFVGGRANAEAQAVRCGCMVYAVSLNVREASDDLRLVAGASGGGYVRVPDEADLHATFVRIAAELRHQYLVGFVPLADDGLVHRVDVRARRPGLTVRARQTFVAEPVR